MLLFLFWIIPLRWSWIQSFLTACFFLNGFIHKYWVLMIKHMFFKRYARDGLCNWCVYYRQCSPFYELLRKVLIWSFQRNVHFKAHESNSATSTMCPMTTRMEIIEICMRQSPSFGFQVKVSLGPAFVCEEIKDPKKLCEDIESVFSANAFLSSLVLMQCLFFDIWWGGSAWAGHLSWNLPAFPPLISWYGDLFGE